MKTSNGHEVVLKDSITGGEYQDIKDILLQETELQGVSGEMKMSGAVITKMTNKAIETVVVSVDGKSDNVLDAVRNLPIEDYEEVVEAVNKATEGLGDKKKEK